MKPSANAVTVLSDLLRGSNLAYAPIALRDIQPDTEFEYTEAKLIALKSIYSVRAGLAAERGSPLGGWSELVDGLSHELTNGGSESKARIYVRVQVLTPLIFTDPSTTKLLGVLVRSTETDADQQKMNELLKEFGREGI